MEQNLQTADTVSSADELFTKIAADPGLREFFYKILVYCQDGRPQEDVKKQIRKWIGTKAALHSAPLLISRLCGFGGLETVEKEGGSELLTTEAGKAVIETASPSNRLTRLFCSAPEYAEIFFTILLACTKPKTMHEIESILSGNVLMARQNILTGYFVGELEDAGGLEWNTEWVSTQPGIEAAIEWNRLKNKN